MTPRSTWLRWARGGAWDARPHSSRLPPRQRRGAVARACGLALAAATGSAAAAPPPAKLETPSGLPVPRYISTKYREVNARGGPGDDHRMLWTYHARALPLQVVAETEEWRRVCDPDGGLGWVHRRTVAETRTVMRTAGRELAMRAHPSDTARAPAVLASRAVAVLGKCDKGWCRITADKISGWVRAGDVWGTDPAPQCRPGGPR